MHLIIVGIGLAIGIPFDVLMFEETQSLWQESIHQTVIEQRATAGLSEAVFLFFFDVFSWILIVIGIGIAIGIAIGITATAWVADRLSGK